MTAANNKKKTVDENNSNNKCTNLMGSQTTKQTEFDPGRASTPVKLHTEQQQQTVSLARELNL